eukprot:Gb_29500 [translate_table: standard]
MRYWYNELAHIHIPNRPRQTETSWPTSQWSNLGPTNSIQSANLTTTSCYALPLFRINLKPVISSQKRNQSSR